MIKCWSIPIFSYGIPIWIHIRCEPCAKVDSSLKIPPIKYFSHHRDSKFSLRWRHNELVGISNHQPHHCLFNRLFKRGSKKTSKFRVTGLCAGNSPVTGEFPAERASNAENVSIQWRHHGFTNWYSENINKYLQISYTCLALAFIRFFSKL